MKKQILFGFLVVLIFVSIISMLSFILSQTSFAIFQTQFNEDYLENLRAKANVECLQNSQCSEGYECIENKCINSNSINVCKNIKLWTPTRKLKTGDSVSNIKRVITGYELPYLLNDGKIFEIINDNLTEYSYTSVILIGENKIEKENNYYVINSGSNIFTYRLTFSRGIDFLNKNIRGQVLRILGKEYVIGDNSAIYLISDNKEIKLEDGKEIKLKTGLFSKSVEGTSVNLIKDRKGDIVMFEIIFTMQSNTNSNKDSIKVQESYIEPVFNSIKLFFNSTDNNFSDVGIGGSC